MVYRCAFPKRSTWFSQVSGNLVSRQIKGVTTIMAHMPSCYPICPVVRECFAVPLHGAVIDRSIPVSFGEPIVATFRLLDRK